MDPASPPDSRRLADPDRLAALRQTGLLDALPDAALDRFVRLARRLVGAPVALISLVDDRRQFFAAMDGLEGWAAEDRGTPLSHSFCQHVVERGAPLRVDDARDHDLVRDNLAVRDLGVAAYLGVPVRDPGGHVLGSFCVLGDAPRTWTDEEEAVLQDLRDALETEVALRAQVAQTEAVEKASAKVETQHHRVLESISDAFFALDHDWRFTYVNDQSERLLQRSRESLLGKSLWDEFPEAVGSPFADAYQEAVRTGKAVQFDAYFPPLQRHFAVRAYPFGDGLSVFFTDVTAEKETEAALRAQSAELAAQARTLETIAQVNALLAAELDPERLVQGVVDAGTELTAAHFGAFFYDARGEDGEEYMLYTVSGVPREAFSQFPMPRNTAVFHPTFSGDGVVRLDDVLEDPRYGKNDPYFGMPEGHLPVRSYLATPVKSREGGVVGGLFFGHPEPGVFDERAEQIALGLADQAAIGLQNAQLYQALRDELADRERAEIALLRSEARFRLFAETAVDVILTIDADSVIQYVNPASERVFGYRPGELVGAGLAVLMPEGFEGLHRAAVARYLETGEKRVPWSHVEVPGLRKDGAVVPLAISFGEYVAEGEHVFTGIIRDVTAQKEAEVALQQSEERARLALDAARLGLWTWDPLTDEGTHDARTKEILGLASGELTTMTEAFGRAVHPDDLPTVQAAVAASLDPSGDGRIEAQWRAPRPGGEPRWVRATAQMFFEGEGDGRHPVQMIGTLADVTEQKESERQLLSVIDNLPELAWSARPDGYVDFYNRRWYEYTGATVEEMMGLGWEAVHDPAILPEVRERWQHSLETGEPFEMEFPLRGADGTFRWFLTRVTPLRDGAGRVTRWIGLTIDVHDRQRAETQARLLAQSGLLVEQALDYDATLANLADLAVPGFSDWCSINLLHDDGSISAVAIAHADPEKVRFGWDLQEIRPPDPDAPTGVPNVIRTGQPELHPVITDDLLVAVAKDEEELDLLRGIGFSSAITVPMRAGDAIIGAISFINADSGRHFDEMDLATAEEIGRRAGSALETARLHRALQQSEALALEAEARTRALFDATPDVVLVYPLGPDGPGPLADVNEAAVETYGYAHDDLLRMRVSDLLVPGTLSVPDALSRLRVERTGRFESVHRTRDGREIPMEIVAHLVVQDGQETVLSVCRDVTERREAEAALRERERELRTLANSIPQLAWMAGAAGDVFWYNQRWYDYTGTTPEAAEGYDWQAVLHPDEAERVAEGYVAAFRTGEPWEDTFRIRSGTGEYRWFLSRALPIRDARGRIARWFGTNTDVTEQRQLLAERDEALDRVRQAQARHRLALEGGGMGTWEWDVPADRLDGDDRIYELWGTRPGEVETVAEFYERLVHPDDLPSLQETVAVALEGETDYTHEFRIVRPDGRVRWIANRGRIVRDASGVALRMFGLSFDVTERRESEEALLQKNREMEQFTYTISHDLKSPLVTINGFLGMLEGHLQAGRTERARAAADRVRKAADRMGQLIEDLLHLSRAGRAMGDPAPVDLGELVGGLADALRPRAQAAGGRIEVVRPLGGVLADGQRLGEVVENLLVNAIHYGLGGGGSQIVVRSQTVPGGCLQLIVEDDGPGIPEPYRRKVFDLFQRLSGDKEGTGIGLALVARIMEVLGGKVWVEPAGREGDREGARFVLEFPCDAVLPTPTSGNDREGAGVDRGDLPPAPGAPTPP